VRPRVGWRLDVVWHDVAREQRAGVLRDFLRDAHAVRSASRVFLPSDDPQLGAVGVIGERLPRPAAWTELPGAVSTRSRALEHDFRTRRRLQETARLELEQIPRRRSPVPPSDRQSEFLRHAETSRGFAPFRTSPQNRLRGKAGPRTSSLAARFLRHASRAHYPERRCRDRVGGAAAGPRGGRSGPRVLPPGRRVPRSPP